jgi:hypothetical protein
LGNSYLVEEAGAITVIDAGVRVHWEELLRGLRIAWHFRASMVIMVRAATNPEESAKS